MRQYSATTWSILALGLVAGLVWYGFFGDVQSLRNSGQVASQAPVPAQPVSATPAPKRQPEVGPSGARGDMPAEELAVEQYVAEMVTLHQMTAEEERLFEEHPEYWDQIKQYNDAKEAVDISNVIFSPEHEHYLNYSYKTLVRMADEGDIVAARALVDGLEHRAKQLSSEGKDELARRLQEERKKWGRRLVVLGYPGATTLPEAGRAQEEFHAQYESAGSADDPTVRQALVEVLAYDQIAELRGDPISRDRAMSYFFWMNRDKLDEDFQFTQEELRKIDQLARAKLQELEQERIQLGFGPFEKIEVPEGVQALRAVKRRGYEEGIWGAEPMGPLPPGL